jgi:nucleotide-binding universal stress UspA family protein
MERILVGLDTSSQAPTVLRRAVDTARRYDARLIAARAVSLPVEFPLKALSIAPDALPARLVAAVQASLDRAVAEVPREVLERAEARLGTPWQVLCDVAGQYGVGLLVVGTHGHSALDRLLGTTVAQVVHHAPCSVLIVREGASR